MQNITKDQVNHAWAILDKAINENEALKQENLKLLKRLEELKMEKTSQEVEE